MDKVGVLVVSKCLSGSAMIDTFLRSSKYAPRFYVVEKQANPFNLERSESHSVVPDLNVRDVARFASKHRDKIAFGLTDTEDFVIAGGRDTIEGETGIPMVCVTKKYAVERSKADQRFLFDEIFSDANPRYKVFDPARYRDKDAALSDLREFVSDIARPVIKPDMPARGAGVGVWGSDFTEEGMATFFLNLLSKGRVVVEEKVEGEESSFHGFSDGKHFVPAPLTRDYKRSLDADRGSLTGGMGSYRGPEPFLPFLRRSDWDSVVASEERAFRKWKGRGSDPGLRGIVLYDALMHTGSGFKVLERNSRGGNTESINLYATLADDLVDVCFRILEGKLKGINFRRQASVVTCAVPLSYGTRGAQPHGGDELDLGGAYALARGAANVRVFPMDVRLEGGASLIGSSRSVAVTGLGPTLEAARRASLRGVGSLVGPLRWRSDIGSGEDVRRSRAHLGSLRRPPAR